MNNIIDGLSMNIEQTNMDKLQSVFPECFAEGKLDIDKLLSLCGEYIDNDFEKYKFEWKGKAECLRLAQKRSTGTLRPCPEESVNWDTTKNLYIEGDNLEVLKLLQTAYYRRVKMIYIDPPYNTGNDFVYEDDFADPLARYKEVTRQTTKSNPETMGRYHTNWLNMMYPRLRLAANLLRDDGVIFISIDEHEEHNLRKVCDEVFGEEHFIASIAVVNNLKGRSDDKYIATAHEWLLIYQNGKFDTHGVAIPEEYIKEYKLSDENGKYRLQGLRKRGSGARREDRPNMFYPFYYNPQANILSLDRIDNSIEIIPKLSDGTDGRWRWGKETAIQRFNELTAEIVSVRNEYDIFQKDYLFSNKRVKPKSVWLGSEFAAEAGTLQTKALLGKGIFDTPKSIDLIKYCLEQATCEDDIILDFFSGSATTAHAVMQLNAEDGGNRQFIMVQLPEVCDQKSEAYKAGYKNICEIGKERIRRAGKNIAETIYKEKFAIKINEQQVDSFAQSCEMLKPREDSIQDELKNVDIGFKVFKLDSSNLKTWDNTPVTAEQMDLLYERMNHMIHRVKADRSDLDMVCEIMLKLGIPLTYSITAVEINGKTAYSIGDDCLLLICLAPDVQPEDVEQMAEYAPAKLIVSRESFVDDTAMANAHYILKDHGVELKLV